MRRLIFASICGSPLSAAFIIIKDTRKPCEGKIHECKERNCDWLKNNLAIYLCKEPSSMTIFVRVPRKRKGRINLVSSATAELYICTEFLSQGTEKDDIMATWDLIVFTKETWCRSSFFYSQSEKKMQYILCCYCQDGSNHSPFARPADTERQYFPGGIVFVAN